MGGGRYNVINAEMISHHDDYHVPFTSATCCKDHIPPFKKTDRINTETISHHEQSCIISHLSRAVSTISEKTMRREGKKRRGKRGNLFLEGGPPYMTSVKV